ncbi:Zinc finger protein [Plakobranchus ocellatus]|uniref:Zinc finger protein n=1 Tax=Plakobranchus ocellatus TaxID=259542 RepID=A0AAV4B4Y3_9GAST|nr:Zinc finger protein [Plakobranchus ocellatus]
MSVKFQFSKLIMEKFLRRSFYDAVLRLYETAHGARIISVSLEGHLSLVVNKNENFVIKLNEIAQRADDREDPHQNRLTKVINFKAEESTDTYFSKKEDDFEDVPIVPTSNDRGEVVINLDDHLNESDKLMGNGHAELQDVQYTNTNQRMNYYAPDELGPKSNDQKPDIDFRHTSNGQLETDQNHQTDQTLVCHNQDQAMEQANAQPKAELDSAGSEEICFLPIGQLDSEKRKYEFDYQEQGQMIEKKSPQKRRKISSVTEAGEEGATIKIEGKEKDVASEENGDVNANSLQLLPHTATAPIVVEEEDSNYGTEDATEAQGQTQQLATIFQLRDQMRTSVAGVGSVGMFRQQDLEELARQQQQWQMVAYQRSIMEKSYLQQQMQQYQRDSERLRWELTTQQQRSERAPPQISEPSPGARELLATSAGTSLADTETAEKLYRQAQVNTEAALLAAAALEQVKKSVQEGQGIVEDSGGGEKLSSQYVRMLEESAAPASVAQAETEYEEGELRHDTHVCVLCGIKFMALDPLIRHMEKHRVAFERSCSVCQSGTLTGNMLKLHMEASHGPETSFPLPSMALPTATVITNSSFPSTSSAPELTQSFQTVQLDLATMKVTQQTSQAFKQVAPSLGKEQEEMIAVASTSSVKTEDVYEYQEENTQSSSRADADGTSDVGGTQQEHESYLGLAPAQFYPLIGCQICGEKFALSEALDQHVETQHKDTGGCAYTCKPCSLSFDSHVEFTKHASRHEMPMRDLGLSTSPTSSSPSASTSSAAVVVAAAAAAAVASSATAAAAQLKCSHCLKGFKSVKQLRLHYVAAHACCHFCEYCRAGFPDAMSLQLHEQLHTLDPEKLSFRCDICSKAFYTQSQCSAHKRTHKDEKAHACEVCGSSFFKRGDLTKHVRTVHSPSRLFSCKFCGKKGTRMDNMRSHVRSHHKNMSRDQIITMIEVIE